MESKYLYTTSMYLFKKKILINITKSLLCFYKNIYDLNSCVKDETLMATILSRVNLGELSMEEICNEFDM